MLASPTGVLVTLPLLVIAVGVGILLVGRDATRGATHSNVPLLPLSGLAMLLVTYDHVPGASGMNRTRCIPFPS